MAVQSALEFIRHMRRESSRKRVAGMDGNVSSLKELMTMARARGDEFTEVELRMAHALDWAMRRRMLHPPEGS